MYYGLFKDIRESAWKCLLEFEIDSLPVDILKITRKAGISVVKNSSVGDLMPNEYAKSYFNGHRWIVIYDDTNPVEVSRFAIAHELGHFFLGHDMTHTRYKDAKQFGKRPKAEQQADMFAIRLLAPACVIKELDLHTAEDISKYCGIPLNVARDRAKRMKTLYTRNMFFTDPLEKAVYDEFYSYLKRANREKNKKVQKSTE